MLCNANVTFYFYFFLLTDEAEQKRPDYSKQQGSFVTTCQRPAWAVAPAWQGYDKRDGFSTEHPWGGFCSILCASHKDVALAGTVRYAQYKVQNPNAFGERYPWNLLIWKGLTPPDTSVPHPVEMRQPCHRSSSPVFPMEVEAWICFLRTPD